MKVILCLAVLVAAAAAVRDAEWDAFKGKFGKTYKSVAEEASRKRIFGDNLAKIAQHNALYEQGKVGFTLGVNAFADLTNKEFSARMNGYRMNKDKKAAELFEMPEGVSAPASIDWRDQGVVTPVKDQGQCGSCWSFSTTGSLEAQHKLSTGTLVSLSEQNLMDCSWDYGNLGCDGGLMDSAFEYIIDNNGIDTESSYPYEERDGTCRYSVANRGATMSSYKDVRSRDEDDLLNAAGSVGPISVAIDASRASFQLYSSGVYYEPNCSELILDHGVLVVGYGAEGGQDYWLVKNSWGTSWGEAGYIKMARNRNNNCGIATEASYPIV